MSSDVCNERVMTLLDEAAQWRLISLLLACPRADWRSHVAALATEVSDEQLKAAACAMAAEASEGLYHTTFGPGGPAAPREVSYREYITPGQSLAELAAFYQAFAFSPASDEPPDHVAVEVDFIAYLRLKEAYAVSRGDEEQARVAADAAQSFQDDHLASIAEPLAGALASSAIVYLQLAAEALARRVGAPRPATPTAGSPLPLLDNDAHLSCGVVDDTP